MWKYRKIRNVGTRMKYGKRRRGIVKEALMDEAMATKVFVKSLEMNITEEDDAENKED